MIIVMVFLLITVFHCKTHRCKGMPKKVHNTHPNYNITVYIRCKESECFLLFSNSSSLTCNKMGFTMLWLFLTNPSSLQALSDAQHEAGYCAFYDECGRNPLLGETLIPPIVPCLSYSRARPLTGQHYKKLKGVCRSCLVFNRNRE